MTPTRIWVLAATAAVCAVVAWLLLRVSYTAIPPLPWTGVPALLLLSIAEAWCGRALPARIRGIGGAKPIPPISVARMAALAKATSLAAALIGGLAAGFLIYVSGSLQQPVPRDDAFAAGGTFTSAIVLVLAALYLEHSCRVPPDDHDAAGHSRFPDPPA
jgi:hypothetical protein